MKSKSLFLKSLIVLLLLLNLLLAFNIGYLRSDTNNTLNGLRQNVQEIKNTLSNAVGSIKYQIDESNKWLLGASVKTDKTRSGDGVVVVSFEWTFSEMDKNAEVYVLYRVKEKEWVWADTYITGGLNYGAILELNPGLEYEYQVVAESGKLRSTDIMSIPEKLYAYEGFDSEIIRLYSEDMQDLQEVVVNVSSRFEPSFDWLGISEINLLVYKNKEFVEKIRFEYKDFMIEEIDEKMNMDGDKDNTDKQEDEKIFEPKYESSYNIGGETDYEFYIEYKYKDDHIIKEYINPLK